MLETYQGILRNNQIEWSGEAPVDLPPDQGVRVHVTLLDKVTPAVPVGNQGERMAATLERLAASQTFADVADPAAWEREVRQDRALSGRDS
jgi:hypothetical protein